MRNASNRSVLNLKKTIVAMKSFCARQEIILFFHFVFKTVKSPNFKLFLWFYLWDFYDPINGHHH